MLILQPQGKAGIPYYEQIYLSLKREILENLRRDGEKLPSARVLAEKLQVSRTTVNLAYSQLVSEGYIEARPKSGYYVCRAGDLISLPKDKNSLLSEIKKQTKQYAYDFSPFGVDIASFPFHTWRKLSNRCMNDLNQSIFQLGDKQGDFELRAAIAHYLHESRAVRCVPGQIIIGAGTDYLLQMLSLIFSKDTVIAIENPGYRRAFSILEGMGFTLFPIRLDQYGIRADLLHLSNAKLVYVTPSHQYPMGIVMPVNRRMELLSWASLGEGRFIIEDDHDSEFRYKGKPIPALQSMDQAGRVIYLGTFSSAIAPAIRAGYMVLPVQLLELYHNKCACLSSTVSRIDQAILSSFLTEGYFERHLNKMRKVYKSRHDCLLRALKCFGPDIRISGENAGLFLLVTFLKEKSEEALLSKAVAADILLCGLNQYSVDKQEASLPTVLFGFARLTEVEIESGVRTLREKLNSISLLI